MIQIRHDSIKGDVTIIVPVIDFYTFKIVCLLFYTIEVVYIYFLCKNHNDSTNSK